VAKGSRSLSRLGLRVSGRITPAFALIAAALVLTRAGSPDAAPAQQTDGGAHGVVFTQYTPLFSNAEILSRLLSPLALEAARDTLARTHKTLSPYSLDLAKESFLVYVPHRPPPSPRGFALLVFVPPQDQAVLPYGWASELDHYGMIFVTPAHAGNETAVLSRRVPLALSAEANIVREYSIDPERIYIGGFSGGSRVAERIALSYPDIFHGALLNAGAEPLGNEKEPLPSRDLFERFQSASRLVYITGVRDTVNLGSDEASSHSMREWCVANVETDQAPDVEHQVMSPAALRRALDQLLKPAPDDPARLATCRSRIDADLQAKLVQADGLISKNKRGPARKLLLDIDGRYGGLAAPRILGLAKRCECGLAGP